MTATIALVFLAAFTTWFPVKMPIWQILSIYRHL